jgi:hypothetical protein
MRRRNKMDRFEISAPVKKAIERENLKVDKVLRQALGIPEEGFRDFPEGTIFLAWYKDRPFSAAVRNGKLKIDDKEFSSLSGAAAHITGRPTTNGWAFWLVRYPGKQEFIPIPKPQRTKAA